MKLPKFILPALREFVVALLHEREDSSFSELATDLAELADTVTGLQNTTTQCNLKVVKVLQLHQEAITKLNATLETSLVPIGLYVSAQNKLLYLEFQQSMLIDLVRQYVPITETAKFDSLSANAAVKYGIFDAIKTSTVAEEPEQESDSATDTTAAKEVPDENV